MAQVEKRYVYTTPKTFLELIRLYKNVLGRKRQQVQEAIDRLDTGLAKLQKTQREVDVLVEEAKIKAVEVEKKVADADVFAEQVSPPIVSSSQMLYRLMLLIDMQAGVSHHGYQACWMSALTQAPRLWRWR